MPLDNDIQLDQIKDMNASEMARQLAIDSYDKRTWTGITSSIQSGKYNTVGSGKSAIYKCNLFLDDMLQEFHNITLPRRGEFKDPVMRELAASADVTGKRIKGWENNPASASVLNPFFLYASEMHGTGISKVSPMEGSKLSAKGKPVVVLGSGHATLAAPHQKWPLVYRSDLANRGLDTRTAVGIKEDSGLNFYIVDPEKYKKFRKILSDFKPDDVINPYSEDAIELRRRLKETK